MSAYWKAILSRASLASVVGRPGVVRPFALHIMSARQPVRSQVLLPGVTSNHVVASMRVQAEEARRANGAGKSEGCVVPTKPGNSGGGKAAERWRHWDKASPGLRASTGMRTRPDADRRDSLRRDSHRGEPDALTAHVRFWEGAVLNWRWLRSCDTTRGNGWQQGTQTSS